MTLKTLLDEHYAPIRGLTKKAINQYAITIRHFSRHLGRDALISDLTPVCIQGFLTTRRSAVAMATVVKDRTHLMALSNWTAREGMLPKFVNLPPMRAPLRIPRAMRWEEATALVRTALETQGHVGDVPAGFWWASLIRSQLETAERIGSHLSLRWSDVDLSERRLTFRAEHRKGRRADLEREVSDVTAAWMAQIRRQPADLVWEWDRDITRLWPRLQAICRRAGVGYRGFHGLRRTAATYMAVAGGLSQAASLLGHSSASTTLRHYIDPAIAKPAVSAVQLLPPLE